MTSAIFDFKSLGAILAKASVLKVEPKQDTVKPAEPVYRPEEDASHIYDYADGAFPADYSCWGADYLLAVRQAVNQITGLSPELIRKLAEGDGI